MSDSEERPADPFSRRGIMRSDHGFIDALSALGAKDSEFSQPQTAAGFVALGNGHDLNGNVEAAIEAYNRAIALNPELAPAYHNRAVTLFNNGRHAEALSDYDAVIRLDPNYPDVRRNRASILMKLGLVARAITDLQDEIKVQPNDPSAYNELAWILATCSTAEHRDGELAVKRATTACELTDWNDSASLDSLAAAYAETGDFGKAVTVQEIALELAPDHQKDGYRSRLEHFKRQECVRA